MPSITPTKAELQKGYRQLENFALDSKVQSVIQEAAKSKSTLEKLKADPLKYFTDRKLKVPATARISITVTRLRFCIWVCRSYGPVLICVRYCGTIIVVIG